ncbi:MAG: hypothetical protein WBF03_07810 [Xanthobacteraceae bacterium]
MITAKNPQKSPSAEIAHMNDLLDEALKGTFPASDPIAINVELESREHGIATTPGVRAPLRSAGKAPLTR